MKNNIINTWRNHFIIEENILETDCSILTKKQVFEASGHLSNFNDYFVKDVKTGNLYRCDHLIQDQLVKLKENKETSIFEKIEIEKILVKLNQMNLIELQKVIKDYKITGIDSQSFSEPGKFNLMFSIMNDSENTEPIYLRPETSQGIFLNFQSLANFNQNKLPFGVGQVGTVFRNEINPQSKLIRAREFQIAEIEYFYNPKFTDHERFDEIADLEICVWPAVKQMSGLGVEKMKLRDMIDQKYISENHAYFLGKIYKFLEEIGIDTDRLRFRQHLPDECAHYSSSCWDGECLTSFGWVECVGCSNRGAFDLQKHTDQSGVCLKINQSLDEPKTVTQTNCFPNFQAIHKIHKNKTKSIINHIQMMSQTDIIHVVTLMKTNGEATLTIDDQTYLITNDMVKFEESLKTMKVEAIVPHVIEPSFGIGRILYCILEHNLYHRAGDPKRLVLALPNNIAPYSISVFPLVSKEIFDPLVKQVVKILKKSKITHLVDCSNESIGKRYSRADEIGTPFAITIDYSSLNTEANFITIRHRDTMEQITVKIVDLNSVLKRLISNELLWDRAVELYGLKD